MARVLRDVEISPPVFDMLEDALEYAERFQRPQLFIDEFVKAVQSGIKFSARLKYDSRLAASGSAVISPGRETIKIGPAALIRDSELFKTIIHEEMHLRLARKARKGNLFSLNLVTDPDEFVEEDYVERVATVCLRRYERALGKFKH